MGIMDFEALRERVAGEAGAAGSVRELEAVRVRYLGRADGELTKVLRSLKDLPEEERRRMGVRANELKQELEELFHERRAALAAGGDEPAIDVTRPGVRPARGRLHPLTIADTRVRAIFSSLNFSVVEGPEVESDYYNFDALNVPADHPARDMWDTFWLRSKQKESLSSQSGRGSKIKKEERTLLRTHTSPMQIRYMETHQPPFQIIVPGRVFRYEATDASHEANFHQVEGLMVGPNVSLANFKFIIAEFLRRFFGRAIEFRLRPSYFPFTEPSVEIDMRFKGSWLEIMGAGMVHPNVFHAVGYDPASIQGFAFGVGLDRLVMLKYKIPDIRMLYSGDIRLVRQF